MTRPLQTDPSEVLQPTGADWLGVVVPAAILLISIVVSWLLFRHFVREQGGA